MLQMGEARTRRMSFKKPRMLEALMKPMKSSVRYCRHVHTRSDAFSMGLRL